METNLLEKEFLDMIAAQQRTVFKVCYIYAKDQDDLNDLFQEVVLNLWKSFPAIGETAKSRPGCIALR